MLLPQMAPTVIADRLYCTVSVLTLGVVNQCGSLRSCQNHDSLSVTRMPAFQRA